MVLLALAALAAEPPVLSTAGWPDTVSFLADGVAQAIASDNRAVLDRACAAGRATVTITRVPEGWTVRWTDRVVEPGTVACAPGRFLSANLDAARDVDLDPDGRVRPGEETLATALWRRGWEWWAGQRLSPGVRPATEARWAVPSLGWTVEPLRLVSRVVPEVACPGERGRRCLTLGLDVEVQPAAATAARARLYAARNGQPAPADLAATVTERHQVTVRAADGLPVAFSDEVVESSRAGRGRGLTTYSVTWTARVTPR